MELHPGLTSMEQELECVGLLLWYGKGVHGGEN